MRLQKYIAKCGVTSRRKAEILITKGRVKVNGQVVTELGTKVSEDDKVLVDDVPIQLEEDKVYILLNKPIGYVTTAEDQFDRKTVLDLIGGVDFRIYPVGRLDYDTSGLLLLTNDGEFTYKMTHPKHEVKKTYIAEVDGNPSEEDVQKLREGVKIDDYITSKAEVEVLWMRSNASCLKIGIHEGRNRQVRKMCESIGHPVRKLKRESFGNLSIGDLNRGEWRFLDQAEVEELLSL